MKTIEKDVRTDHVGLCIEVTYCEICDGLYVINIDDGVRDKKVSEVLEIAIRQLEEAGWRFKVVNGRFGYICPDCICSDE